VPTHRLPDQTPVVEFDPRLEVSPFTLFRRLASGGEPPLLVDVRRATGERTLRGAEHMPADPWTPPADRDTVLFDDDGSASVEIARRLQATGHARVRALFGGLELYAFALDPEVVGTETYLLPGGVSTG
jgi:hypothetical protein